MKVLLFSSLFPSSVRPVHGIFVETRLRELLKTGKVQAQVVAPVPWFPFKHPRFGDYAQFAATPPFEHRHGVDVHHPRYALLPRIGMHMAPYSMAVGTPMTRPSSSTRTPPELPGLIGASVWIMSGMV